MSQEPSAAQKLIGDFAPKLVDLTDRVLFCDVWERPELSKRDRSLATVSAQLAMNRPDQLRFQLGKALENGVEKEELIEVITHLAFYSGWPNAMSAIMVQKRYSRRREDQRRRRVSVPESTEARCISCRSSRKLPGHGCATSAASAAGVRAFGRALTVSAAA